MKVEILYFLGCPNHAPAVERVREVLKEEGTDADLLEIEVNDPSAALSVAFLGSPTIRIDGQDVEPAARAAAPFGMSCRTYITDGQRTGVPPSEWIRAAVKRAREMELNRPTNKMDACEISARCLSQGVAGISQEDERTRGE